MYKDMKGERCSHCHKGSYTESTDQDGSLSCSSCGRMIHRWQAPTQQSWETYPGEDPYSFDDRYDR